MSKEPGSHNTPRAIAEEILRLHVEEGCTYRQFAEKFDKPFKTITTPVHTFCPKWIVDEQGKASLYTVSAHHLVEGLPLRIWGGNKSTRRIRTRKKYFYKNENAQKRSIFRERRR